MSHLLINQIFLRVDSEYVELVKTRVWSKRVLHKQRLNYPAMKVDHEKQPLNIIKELLATHGKSSNCEVVLSNSFVRQLIIPEVDLGLSDKELTALAKHCFLETYGQKADAWRIKVDAIHHVACAVDNELIEALSAICKAYGCQLQSVQSYLVNAFNQIRHLLDKQLNCLVQVDSTRLTIILLDGKHWLRLSSVPYTWDWSSKLPSIIKREILLSGLDLQPIKTYIQYEYSAQPVLLADDPYLNFEIAKPKQSFFKHALIPIGLRV